MRLWLAGTDGNAFAGGFLGEGFDDEKCSCDGGFREPVDAEAGERRIAERRRQRDVFVHADERGRRLSAAVSSGERRRPREDRSDRDGSGAREGAAGYGGLAGTDGEIRF